MIVLAHKCSLLRVPFSDRMFTEPYGDYHLALEMVADAVSETNRQERERAERSHHA